MFECVQTVAPIQKNQEILLKYIKTNRMGRGQDTRPDGRIRTDIATTIPNRPIR